MMMNKNKFWMVMLLLLPSLLFTACSSDDDDDVNGRQTIVNKGFYVVCSGNMFNKISGSLTYGDYGTKTSSQNVFEKNNMRKLGGTVNDAVVYGSKLYIVSTDENTIEVVNNKTLKSIKQLKTTELLNDKDGYQPRHIVASNGKVFVTTFGGYVIGIDTLNLEKSNAYKVGSYPEGIAAEKNKLYVANSDYGKGQDPSISEIDLLSGSVDTWKSKKVLNPSQIYAKDGIIYIQDNPYYKYDPSDKRMTAVGGPSSVKMIDKQRNVTTLFPSTTTSFDGTNIFAVNAPFGSKEIVYSIYNISSNKPKILKMSETGFSPACLSIDPVRGYLLVAFYNKNIETGYPDYSGNSEIYQYDLFGNLLNKYIAGVGPTAIVLSTNVKQ